MDVDLWWLAVTAHPRGDPMFDLSAAAAAALAAAASSTTSKTRAPLISDMQLDIRTSSDTLLFVMELSDAMKRGVRHYRLDGSPLERLDNVVEALIFDGEVFFDEASSTPTAGH
jgi:hypothetical protein